MRKLLLTLALLLLASTPAFAQREFGPSIRSFVGPASFYTTTSGTNDIVDGLRLYRRTTGTASAGIGLSLPFYVENGSGTDRTAAVLRASLTTVTDAAEVGRLAFSLINGGSVAEQMIVQANTWSGGTTAGKALTIETTTDATKGVLTLGVTARASCARWSCVTALARPAPDTPHHGHRQRAVRRLP